MVHGGGGEEVTMEMEMEVEGTYRPRSGINDTLAVSVVSPSRRRWCKPYTRLGKKMNLSNFSFMY